MTSAERDEQRRHWRWEGRMLGAILSVLSAGVLAGAGWVISTEGRLGRMQTTQEQLIERADRDDARHVETMRRLGAAEAARADTREAIARVEERLAAQGESLRRVEDAIRGLTDYLREREDGG